MSGCGRALRRWRRFSRAIVECADKPRCGCNTGRVHTKRILLAIPGAILAAILAAAFVYGIWHGWPRPVNSERFGQVRVFAPWLYQRGFVYVLSGADGWTFADTYTALIDAAQIRQRLDADGIAFVMLNRRTASPALREYVEHAMSLTPIARDDERTLYLSKP